MLNKIWYLIGGASIIYFIGVVYFTGLSSKFHIFWLAFGMICLIIGRIPNKVQTFSMLPTPTKAILTLILVACISFVGILEGCVISGFVNEPPKDLDYIIVLGAQVKWSGMSRILKQRTDAAGEYLLENPKTKVVVSGGKGYNEPTSEAAAMEEYLLNHYHISKDRIISEDKSTSTAENIAFSKKYVPLDSKVGIVTSNFHAFRAGKIAKKAGFKEVHTVPAFSELPLLPSNMIREGLALFKDWVVGNI